MTHKTKRPSTTGREKGIQRNIPKKSKSIKVTRGGNLIDAGKKYVKEQLGLVEKVAGPIKVPKGVKLKTTGLYASKLQGTKGGIDFYGVEAQQATLDFIKGQGKEAGLYATTTDGSMMKDSSGNPILTTKGKELMYGKSDSAMGSGDPTGILSSTAISQPMHQAQKKFQALTLGVLSMALPMGAGTLMRMGAADAWKDRGQTGYNEYLGKFYSNVSGETSSYAKRNTGGGGVAVEQEVSSANITDTRTGGKTRKDDETRFKKIASITKGGSGAIGDDRTLMKRSGKTITAKRIKGSKRLAV